MEFCDVFNSQADTGRTSDIPIPYGVWTPYSSNCGPEYALAEKLKMLLPFKCGTYGHYSPRNRDRNAFLPLLDALLHPCTFANQSLTFLFGRHFAQTIRKQPDPRY